MLPRHKPHGWSHKIEVTVCLYCLACGTSYRATADILAILRATVARVMHTLVEAMKGILHMAIHFPKSGWPSGFPVFPEEELSELQALPFGGSPRCV